MYHLPPFKNWKLGMNQCGVDNQHKFVDCLDAHVIETYKVLKIHRLV
jgi:hypothetical protein